MSDKLAGGWWSLFVHERLSITKLKKYSGLGSLSVLHLKNEDGNSGRLVATMSELSHAPLISNEFYEMWINPAEVHIYTRTQSSAYVNFICQTAWFEDRPLVYIFSPINVATTSGLIALLLVYHHVIINLVQMAVISQMISLHLEPSASECITCHLEQQTPGNVPVIWFALVSPFKPVCASCFKLINDVDSIEHHYVVGKKRTNLLHCSRTHNSNVCKILLTTKCLFDERNKVNSVRWIDCNMFISARKNGLRISLVCIYQGVVLVESQVWSF